MGCGSAQYANTAGSNQPHEASLDSFTRALSAARHCACTLALSAARHAACTLALLTLCAAVVAPTLARADEPLLVGLTLDPCTGTDAPTVRRLLAIELSIERPVVVRAAMPDDAADVGVTCVDTSVLALRVVDRLTGKEVARRVDLATTSPAGRARLLALALAELVSATWLELDTQPRPDAPAPLDATASPAARAAGRAVVRTRAPRPPREGRLTIAVSGVARTGDAPQHGSFGAAIGVAYRIGEWLLLGVELRGEAASVAFALGDVGVQWWTGSAWAGATRRFGPLWLSAELGVRLGPADIVGAPAVAGISGANVDGWAVALALRPRVEFDLGGPLGVAAGLEFAWVAEGVTGRVAEQTVGVAGLSLAGMVGLVVRP